MRVLMSLALFVILAGLGATGCAKKQETREAPGAKASQAGKGLPGSDFADGTSNSVRMPDFGRVPADMAKSAKESKGRPEIPAPVAAESPPRADKAAEKKP